MKNALAWTVGAGVCLWILIAAFRPDIVAAVEFALTELVMILVFAGAGLGLLFLAVQSVGTSEDRQQWLNAMRASPLATALDLLMLVSVTLFFLMLLLASLQVVSNDVNWFYWLPVSWIVIWVVKLVTGAESRLSGNVVERAIKTEQDASSSSGIEKNSQKD